ncbi:MAG: hypothetical protein RIM99_05645 [Cyclobacteriaceae bacterium]
MNNKHLVPVLIIGAMIRTGLGSGIGVGIGFALQITEDKRNVDEFYRF